MTRIDKFGYAKISFASEGGGISCANNAVTN